ncbi:MAG: hypothetical protein KDD22_00460, partial [Bdellovibrionales bacterium]|nr:hypothetical protein [Bdellovibrionales bacterium]
MKTPAKWKAGFFFLAHVLAGAFHYLFQVLAGKQLSVELFGEFSAWLAWLNLGLGAGAIAQYMANFFPLASSKIRTWGVGSILGGMTVLSLFFFWEPASALEIGILTLLVAPFDHWL